MAGRTDHEPEEGAAPVRQADGVRWTAAVFDLLFGDCCPICGVPGEMTEMPWCPGCGRTVRLIRRCICPGCRRYCTPDFHSCPEPHDASQPAYVIALGAYDDALGSVVRALKYEGRRLLARATARLLADCFPEPAVFDTVVAVPTGREKKRRNGFGHAEEIGRALARCLNVRFADRGLTQTRRIRDQIRLSAEERRCNLSGALACVESEGITDRCVLVVDDVMTTGATLEEAGRALTVAGARRVAGAVVALNLGGRPSFRGGG